MAYRDLKDSNRKITADKVLRDKAFNIAKNLKCDGYQRGIASMVYRFFDKKNSGGTVKNEVISNKELADELHKAIVRKCKKKKYTRFLWTMFGTQSSRYVIDK